MPTPPAVQPQQAADPRATGALALPRVREDLKLYPGTPLRDGFAQLAHSRPGP
jgi:hypothetical protein